MVGAYEFEFGVNISYHHYCKMSMKEIQVSFRFTCTKRPQMPNQTTNPRRENYTETWTHSIFFWWYCCCWNASLDFFRFQFHCVHILLLFFFLLLLVVVVFLCIKRSGWRLNLSNFFLYIVDSFVVRGAKLQVIGLEISYSHYHYQIELINGNELRIACG